MSKTYKNIDELFRSEFKDFEIEPPAYVWENVKKSIPDKGLNKTFYRFKYGGIIGLSSIAILIGLFSFLNFNAKTDSSSYQTLSVNTQNEIPLPKESRSIETITSSAQTGFKTSTATQSAETKQASTQVSHNSRAGEQNGITESEKEISVNSNSTVTSEIKPQAPESTPLRDSELHDEDNLLAMADVSGVHSTSLPLSSGLQQSGKVFHNDYFIKDMNLAHPTQPDNPVTFSDYGKKANLLFGLTFTPEISFFSQDNSHSNYSYSIDGSVIFKFNGYLLQSGLGAQIAFDDGDYKVDFRKYLGSYEDVYDVTFDTTENGVVPVYHTQTVSVYDSLPHYKITPTKNRYTYLQLPLFFGYGEDLKRISWFIKGGPSLSILIHEHQQQVNIDSGNDKIISFENKIPKRISTNWSFVFSAGIGYKLGNKVSLTVEPAIRYYFKSVYERNSITTKHPYSIGIRSGLLFEF